MRKLNPFTISCGASLLLHFWRLQVSLSLSSVQVSPRSPADFAPHEDRRLSRLSPTDLHTDANPPFYASTVLDWLDEGKISYRSCPPTNLPIQFQTYCPTSTFVELEKSSILLHLIPTPTKPEESLPPTLNRRLTEWVSSLSLDEENESSASPYYSKIIHLHQDIWLAQNDIVKARLLVQSLAATPQRIFARKTTARRLNATEARSFLTENHLWGATKAKHHYGLFRTIADIHSTGRRRRGPIQPQEELVAVATFSKCRTVQRNNRQCNSHELIRYCSSRDATVVGGISKLLKTFVREQESSGVVVDDIVTLVDRDWGEANGWHSMGFETMTILDPLVMVVNPAEMGIRRYLVGAGLSHPNIVPTTSAQSNPTAIAPKGQQQIRRGLPRDTRAALDEILNPQLVMDRLADENFYPVYDAGVERLYKVLSPLQDQETPTFLWQMSQPKYVKRYYSNNTGITSLLKYAATTPPPLDSNVHSAYLDSWRATSGTASSAPQIYSAPSSMDPDATIEIRQRANGWRTMGIVGSKKGVSSIYHSIYKVDPDTEHVEPDVVIAEQIKTMAVLSLADNVSAVDDYQQSLRFLHFGYGAGTLVRLLAHHVTNSYHVAVELDQGVVEAANSLKPDLPNVSVLAEDALQYVQFFCDKQEKRFDCICIDVFDEKNLVPHELYSTSFLRTLSNQVLTANGVLVQNFHSGGKRRNLVIKNASKAVGEVFVDVCWVPTIDSKSTGGNLVMVASKVPMPQNGDGTVSLCSNAFAVQSKYDFSFDAVARVQSATRTTDLSGIL